MRYLTVLLVFVLQATFSESCMCLPTHPQKAFNTAQFVVLAEVLTDGIKSETAESSIWVKLGLPPALELVYTIRILRIYKQDEQISHFPGSITDEEKGYIQNNIHTPLMWSTCGKCFSKGERYILSGRFVKERLRVSQCDWSVQADEITQTEKRGLEGSYISECDVTTCFQAGNCSPATSHKCKWEVPLDMPYDESCHYKHAVCRVENNRCRWATEHDDFYTCSKKQLPFLNNLK